MSVPDFAARPQLSEDVARLIRSRIFDGSYAAGSYIRLDQLAAELGISVTPVREALFALRAEGLIAQQPRRGFVVLPVTGRDVTDVANVQAHVGGELAARAALNITDDQLRELKHGLPRPNVADISDGYLNVSLAKATEASYFALQALLPLSRMQLYGFAVYIDNATAATSELLIMPSAAQARAVARRRIEFFSDSDSNGAHTHAHTHTHTTPARATARKCNADTGRTCRIWD